MLGRRHARSFAFVLGGSLLLATAGCSQLLGISDIHPAPDGAADAIDAGAKDVDVSGDTAALSDSHAPADQVLADAVREDGGGDQVRTDDVREDASSDRAGDMADSNADAAIDTYRTASDGPSDRLASDAMTCPPGDLSNVGAGDFTISFTLKTTQPDAVISLVNQRFLCNVGNFWDIRLVNGLIYVELSDASSGLLFFTSNGLPLNDGIAHAIAVFRKRGVSHVTVDGVGSGKPVATPQSFGPLAPVLVGRDVCDGVNGTTGLAGGLDELCVRAE